MPEFAALVEGYRRFRATDYLARRQRWEVETVDAPEARCGSRMAEGRNIIR